MDEALRWFGPTDAVTLADIRQTGATSVFTSLYEVPYGEAWPEELIISRRDAIRAAGLEWSVVESVPVSEAIKARSGPFAQHIQNYATTLRRLGAAGIRTVIYNFMPVLDWVRTDLRYRLPDGTEALRYEPAKFAAFDLFGLQRPGAASDFSDTERAAAAIYWESLDEAGRTDFINQTLDLFPGVRLNLSLDGLRRLLAAYHQISVAQLQEHLRLFLEAVTPAAMEAGMRLAIHPDDPPFPILGLPRIASTEKHLREITEMVDVPANGICYCTGSLSARLDNDLPGIVRRLGPRIHAVHLRSVQHEANGVFFEADHLDGCVDMPAVMSALLDELRARRAAGRSDVRLALRPDHGHTMLDDLNKPPPACPGYSLIGRLRGLAELRGLQRGLAFAAAQSGGSGRVGG